MFKKNTFGPSGELAKVDLGGNECSLETSLSLLPAQTALTAITTAQTLMSLAFLAGAFGKVGRALRVSGMVIFTVSTGTPTTTIAIKLGTVTLFTVTTAALAASTNGQLTFDCLLNVVATGSSGTVEAHGTVKAQLSTALGTAIAEYADQSVAVSAVDLTKALTLAVSIAASTAMASAQLRQGFIEVVN